MNKDGCIECGKILEKVVVKVEFKSGPWACDVCLEKSYIGLLEVRKKLKGNEKMGTILKTF